MTIYDYSLDQDVLVTGRNNLDVPLVVTPCRNWFGNGPVGNDSRGPSLIFNHTGDGVVFDGSGEPYRGTGGGLRGMKLLRGPGQFGGTSLRIGALDAAHRAGELIFHDLKLFNWSDVGSEAAGSSDYGVVVDGASLSTPGQAGIRRLEFHAVRVASTRQKAFWFRNATHLTMVHCQTDPGDEPLGCVVHFEGGQNISGYGCIFNGPLIFDDVTDVDLHGPRLGHVSISSSCRNVVLGGVAESLTIAKGATGSFHGSVRGKTTSQSLAFKVYG